MSAQELRAYLNAFDLDAIFIPAVALRGEKANISKICSICNTIEGGLDVLLFSPNGKMSMNLEATETKTEDEEHLDEGTRKKKVKEKSQWYNILDRLLANDNKGSFIFKQDTVAEAGFSRMILGNKDWKSKSSFKQIPVKRQENMDDVLNNQLNSELSNDDYCIIFTWEPQTSEIEHSLTARNHKPIRIPAHIFSAEEKPTFYITFDLVARTEKLQELKDSKAFNNFLRTLQDGIDGIEEDIKQEVMHYSLRKIASMLGFKNEEDYLKIHKRLHEINFQLQFYPDWVFASKSSKPNLGDQMGWKSVKYWGVRFMIFKHKLI